MSKAAARKVPIAFDPFDPFGSEQRMIDAFMRAANRFDAKHAKSRTAARKQLQKEGILTKSGNLTKRYGG
jgi:hypothetical protein